MRTYGRTFDENGNATWTEIVETSYIWLATLTQTLRLNQGESPFYGNYGIPAEQSVMTQIAPDSAITRTQSQYAPYFSSLVVTKSQVSAQPTYYISAVFTNGTIINSTVAS